jgi:hypothetical protein
VLAQHKRLLSTLQGSRGIGLAQIDSVVRNVGLIDDFCLGIGLAYLLDHLSAGWRRQAALRENYALWGKAWGRQ